MLDEIAAQYDLGQWHAIEPLSGGFRIAAEAGDVRVTVSSAGRSDASLLFEAMLLAHLEDRAYLAPRLVRTRAGRPWHRSATGGTALVTEWVQGGVVDASLAQHRRRSVRALAEYHAAVRSFPPRLRAEGGATRFLLEREGPAALEAFTGKSGWHLDADGRRAPATRLFLPVAPVPPRTRAAARRWGHPSPPRDPRLLRARIGRARRLPAGIPGRWAGGPRPQPVRPEGSRPGGGAEDLRFGGGGRIRPRSLRRRHVGLRRGGPPVARRGGGPARHPPGGAAGPGLPSEPGPAGEGAVHDQVEAIDEEAEGLRWLEQHEHAFVEALVSSCVG